MKDVLTGRIALVTGASRGIGRGVALALAKAGAVVVGTATTSSGAEAITTAFQEAGVPGQGAELNVNSADSVLALIAMIKEKYGPISILVNNAAITQDNLFLRMKDEEWLQVMETDLTSVFRLSRACLRDMVKARFGRIINIGSVVGSMGNPGQANYCAAKAGVIGLTKALAMEVGSRDITVNTVSPGFITTDMTNASNEEQKQAIFDRIPMKKLGTVEDVASAVLFLASGAASYITGQTLHVNGGLYMG